MVLRIRLERVSRNIKMYDLARELGLDSQQWRKIEVGEKTAPADVADRASRLFGRPAEELFKVVDAEPLVMAGAGR